MLKPVTATVLRNQQVSARYFCLEIRLPETSTVLPGQFYQLRCPGAFLRRPFSVMRQQGRRLSFLYQVIGKGTAYLQSLQRNDTLDVLGPLGKGYPLPDSEKALLVAGGTGLGGILPLAFTLHQKKKPFACLVGFRDPQDIPVQFLASLPFKVDVIDEQKGYVTNLMTSSCLKQFDVCYSCGPLPMLRAVEERWQQRGPHYVSLETRMGCGFGVCYTCPVPTRNGAYVRACHDGPVFSTREIDLHKVTV